MASNIAVAHVGQVVYYYSYFALDAVPIDAITVFPLNCVGRPLGFANANDASQVPAGGNWAFQTEAIDTPSVDYAAYPAASFRD